MSERQAGIALFIGAMAVFASQDAVTKQLASEHSPIMLAMIRYWAFAAFVMLLSAAQPGGLRRAVRTEKPWVQILRGLLMVAEIVATTYSFAVIGLAESHAALAAYPLMVTAAAAFLLGERVSGAQWGAIVAGAIGVLILINPGSDLFDPMVLIPLGAAGLFAAYQVLTRWVSQWDSPGTNFFYTGIVGAVAASLVGPFFWSEMTGEEWILMGLLCVLSVLAQFLLIQAYTCAEAAVLQPFAYTLLLLASVLGVLFFNEVIDARLFIGAAVIVGAGLFALFLANPAPQNGERASPGRG